MRFQKRIAVFISGTGSNLNAALEMNEHQNIALVVSSKKSALGILKARRAGVPVHVLKSPPDWGSLHQILKNHRIDSLFLLGFMKILPADFVEGWRGRIFNIHPSLLPTYPGLLSLERSFSDRQPIGITVHEVIAEMDAGTPIVQRRLASSRALDLYGSLDECRMEVHRNEHKVVREVLAKWNRVAIS